MIDKEIFAQQMALLADRIGRPLAGPTQREYHRQLSLVLTTEQFVAAATIAFSSWGGEYRTWPSPQQFVELVQPTARASLLSTEAFEIVLQATGNAYGNRREQLAAIEALGAPAVRAFRAAGGFRDFTGVLESDLPFLRRRFVEAYEASCENTHSERTASLALSDADARVAGLVARIANDKALPASTSNGRRSA